MGSTQPKRASFRARQRGSPLGPTQGLLSSSTLRTFSRARHRERKGLLSSSAKRTFSRTRQRMPPPRLNTESSSQARHRASSRARQTGPSLGLNRENLLSGTKKEGLLLRSLQRPTLRLCSGKGAPLALMPGKESILSDSAKRASSQTSQRGPPPRLNIELLSGSAQRLTRGPCLELGRETSLGLGKEGLLSGSTQGLLSNTRQRTPCQAQQKAPPLRLGEEGLLLGSSQRASSQGPSIGGLLSGSAEKIPFEARQRRPPFRLVSYLAQCASFRARHRQPLSGSAERTFSRDQQSLLSGSTQRAFSRAQQRKPSLGLEKRGSPLVLITKAYSQTLLRKGGSSCAQ